MLTENPIDLEIIEPSSDAEFEVCARMMSESEPWITLARDYGSCLQTLTHHTKEVYIGKVESAIVGFVILNMHGAFAGFIQTICVAPEWRNKGIGSQLLDFVEHRILTVMPNVFMCVSSFNPDAKRLYLRRNYEIVGEMKDFIVKGHSEILLRKSVGPITEFRRKLK
ncbi:GNAT family N-acetyltransferase [bacterium]|nr:GNAT family N-acetyltransferase [bacterium]